MELASETVFSPVAIPPRHWGPIADMLHAAGSFSGRNIHIEVRPGLWGDARGRESDDRRGFPVHGAADIKRRFILIDAALMNNPPELRRILLHEVFHFVWVRLGNPRRWSFEQLLQRECAAGARGEIAWPAEQCKEMLVPSDVTLRTGRWRLYCCESFCDTAAWVFGHSPAPPASSDRERCREITSPPNSRLPKHQETTLPLRWRLRRHAWFLQMFPRRVFPV